MSTSVVSCNSDGSPDHASHSAEMAIGYKHICVFFPVDTVVLGKHPQVLRLRLDFYSRQTGEGITAGLVRFYSSAYMGPGVVLFRCVHSPRHR